MSDSSSSVAPAEDIRCQQSTTEGQWNVSWAIDHVSLFAKQCGGCLTSPKFQAGYDQSLWWTVTIYPKGKNNSNYGNSNSKTGQQFVSVVLSSLSTATVSGTFTFALLNKDNKMTNIKRYNHLFSNGGILSSDQFIDCKHLIDSKNGLYQNGYLTLVCDMLIFGPQVNLLRCISYKPNLVKLSQDLRNLYISCQLSDINISVGEKTFNVHKAVLAIRSPVFAAMFEHPLKETETNTVEIKDVDPEVMEEVLLFMYSEHCPQLKNLAADILPVAEKYCLDGLKNMAQEELSAGVSVENAADLLILAYKCNASNLKANVIKFINANAKQVMKTTDWKLVFAYPELLLEVYKAIHDQCLVFNKTIEL